MRNKSSFKQKNNQGFTLIELLVVISVISLMASTTLVAFVNVRYKARYVKAQTDTKSIFKAEQLYILQRGVFPTSTASLVPDFLSAVPQPACSNWFPYTLVFNTSTVANIKESGITIRKCASGGFSCITPTLLFTACDNEAGTDCSWVASGLYGQIDKLAVKEITCRE